MPRYLILRLDGPMQAWGMHTYEDFRPSNLFPTRSGLLGLVGACLGIDREDHVGLEQLAQSVEFTVRVDREVKRQDAEEPISKSTLRLPDYHTVYEARRANRPPKKGETIESWREYLFDAAFTVAVGEKENAPVTLGTIGAALRRPCFTPVLGRRSCPITRPLLDGTAIEAKDAKAVLAMALPVGGLIYAEGDLFPLNPCGFATYLCIDVTANLAPVRCSCIRRSHVPEPRRNPVAIGSEPLRLPPPSVEVVPWRAKRNTYE